MIIPSKIFVVLWLTILSGDPDKPTKQPFIWATYCDTKTGYCVEEEYIVGRCRSVKVDEISPRFVGYKPQVKCLKYGDYYKLDVRFVDVIEEGG